MKDWIFYLIDNNTNVIEGGYPLIDNDINKLKDVENEKILIGIEVLIKEKVTTDNDYWNFKGYKKR